MPKLSTNLAHLGTETAYAVSEEARIAKEKGVKIYPFHIGDLNFRTATPVVETAKKALDDGKTGYCASAGILPLRQAIAEYAGKERGMHFTADNISIQPGGKPLIWKFLSCVLEQGDEVLYPSPGYPIYESMVNFLKGVPKPYIYKDTSNGITLDMPYLKGLLSSRSKVIIYNNMQNPTGHVSSQNEMQEIANLAIEKDLWVLSDEAYFKIHFMEQPPRSIASLPNMQERTVILYTCSKTWSMTGWRLGCGIGPVELIDKISKINCNDEGCTTHFVQWAAIPAFHGECDDYTTNMVSELKKRRDLLVERINKIEGFSCHSPEATFYCYVNATKAFNILGVNNYEEFRKKFLAETGISFCTREHFGASLPFETEKYIRLAFSGIDSTQIQEAMDVLDGYMKKKISERANKKRPQVFITRELPKIAYDIMKEHCDIEVWPEEDKPPRNVLLEKVKDCDGLVSLLTDGINEELLASAPRLKVVAQVAVGYNNIDLESCTRHNVMVSNTPGVLTETTSETAIALLLAASRRVCESDRYVRKGDWKVSWSVMMQLGYDIHGSLVGIVGFGRIGRQVAKILQTMGAKIIYYDKFRDENYEKEHNVEYASTIHEICRKADFISIHVDLNKETHHFINEECFSLMKPNCVFVNTSRGPVVDQTALYNALKNKKIFAAGLDVFEVEPISSDDPLLALENVVVLPHLGSASIKTREAMATLAAKNIVAYFTNQPLPNLLNTNVKDTR